MSRHDIDDALEYQRRIERNEIIICEMQRSIDALQEANRIMRALIEQAL